MKKAVAPAVQREFVDYTKAQHGVSLPRACHIVGISDSVYRYQPNRHRDNPIILTLQAASERYPVYGFSRLLKVLHRNGHRWNHKRVHRIYCELNLNKRRKGKRRLRARSPHPLTVPATANYCSSKAFTNDALMSGRRFRTFNVVNDLNREGPAIEVDLGLPAARIIRVLERIIAWRYCVTKLRMDNGLKFISSALADGAEQSQLALKCIKLETPTQNSFIERFNRTDHEAVLNRYAFKTPNEVRELTEVWMREYNEERGHDSLGYLTPWKYLAKNHPPETSNRNCRK